MADYEEEPRDDYDTKAPESPSNNNSPGYDDQERERSRSYGDRYERGGDRRSMSPPARDDRSRSREYERDRDMRDAPPTADDDDEVDAQNEGTNLFVTGLSRSAREEDVEELFAKYGKVEKCQIMLDPHTRESRGFGFVNMLDVNDADLAMKELAGAELFGRTLAVEKAKRKRPRTPTPGKYFGPPKPPRRGGRGGFSRYDDRSGGGGRYRDFRGPPRGHYDDRRYDDYYRRPRYDDRDSRDRYYRDRGYGGRYDDRDRYPPRDYRDRGYDRRPPPPRDLPPAPRERDDRPSFSERDRDRERDDRYASEYRERDRDDYR